MIPDLVGRRNGTARQRMASFRMAEHQTGAHLDAAVLDQVNDKWQTASAIWRSLPEENTVESVERSLDHLHSSDAIERRLVLGAVHFWRRARR